MSRKTTTPDGSGLNSRGRRLLHSTPKDLKPLVRAALAEGWRLDHRGSHTVLIAPTGGYRVPVPSASNNTLRVVFRNQLRDHGVPLD